MAPFELRNIIRTCRSRSQDYYYCLVCDNVGYTVLKRSKCAHLGQRLLL